MVCTMYGRIESRREPPVGVARRSNLLDVFLASAGDPAADVFMRAQYKDFETQHWR